MISYAILCVLFYIQSSSCYEIQSFSPNRKVYDGESPYWRSENQNVYYSDLLSPNATVCRFSSRSKRTYCADIVGETFAAAIIPIAGTEDQYLVANDLKGQLITWDGRASKIYETEILFEVEKGFANNIERLRVDPTGERVYFGTFYVQLCGAPNNSSLYSRSPEEKVVKRLTGLTLTSGFAWYGLLFYSLDGCSYYLNEYDWDPVTGDISNPRIVFDFREVFKGKPTFFPVGLNVDVNGNIVVGYFRGSEVVIIDPRKKKIIRKIKMPTQIITMGTFGGLSLNELYVTSGGVPLNINTGEVEKNNKLTPYGGSLFRITGLGYTGFAGIPLVLPSERSHACKVKTNAKKCK